MAPPTWSVPQAGKRLRQALQDDDGPAVQELLVGLFTDAAVMCADNDLARIARVQGQVARWQATSAPHPESPIAPQLDALAATLDSGWRTISLRRDAALRHAAGATIREQIVAFLQESPGRRPSEIARQLEVDPSQVSRALRTLVDDGEIERLVPKGHDQRAVTYAPAVAAARLAAA